MWPFLLKASFVFAIAGHGADLASTEHCLGAGKCREANPWLARYDSPVRFGVAKMLVAGGSEWGLYEYVKPRGDGKDKRRAIVGVVMNGALGATFLSIGMRNARQTR